MSIESLLDHKCDIYHLYKEEVKGTYGQPNKIKEYYKEVPDIIDSNCHFSVGRDNISITQSEPQNELSRTFSITLPLGTDIRINDRIIDKFNGLMYKVSIPRKIRNHHMKAELYRYVTERGL